jgi:precorrin-8X/cobalt-precorrin-8 methylmutase
MRAVHPIEARSYAILREIADLNGLPPLTRAVTERVVHASADLDYLDDLVCAESALAAGAAALRSGAAVVADVEMVAAGISRAHLPGQLVCAIADPDTAELARERALTRSAAAVHVAFGRAGTGAVWVVGCAPTALAELLDVDARPALVIGLPVGFVGAVEAKAALRGSGLPAVSNRGRKGGSAVAVAALNALLYTEGEA